MPLTPAEVHNVAFKKPPIGKRGYDEEEVDAFLDVVEVELARLIEENNDLRSRGGGGANGAKSGVNPAELAAVRDENNRLQVRIGELEKALTQGNDGAAQQVVALQQQLAQAERQLAADRQALQQAQQAAQQAQQAAAQGQGPSAEAHHAQAVQMLALAQQTADTHLTQSKAEAERLLSEAQANAQATLAAAQSQADKQLSEARTRAEQLDRDSNGRASQALRDAEQRATTITAQFEQRKDALERRVEQLRTFEREYRTRLKSYLESQLRDLDASGWAEPAQQSRDSAQATPQA
ncbi:MAG: DivIVA domain-containing protein [Actinomycetota bacterium]